MIFTTLIAPRPTLDFHRPSRRASQVHLLPTAIRLILRNQQVSAVNNLVPSDDNKCSFPYIEAGVPKAWNDDGANPGAYAWCSSGKKRIAFQVRLGASGQVCGVGWNLLKEQLTLQLRGAVDRCVTGLVGPLAKQQRLDVEAEEDSFKQPGGVQDLLCWRGHACTLNVEVDAAGIPKKPPGDWLKIEVARGRSVLFFNPPTV